MSYPGEKVQMPLNSTSLPVVHVAAELLCRLSSEQAVWAHPWCYLVKEEEEQADMNIRRRPRSVVSSLPLLSLWCCLRSHLPHKA